MKAQVWEILPSFSGLFFWGSGHLPGELALGLEEIREWADGSGLLWNEGQLVTDETVRETGQHFGPDDHLLVLVHLYVDQSSGRLAYAEYPYVELATLIRKKLEVDLVWWGLGALDDPPRNFTEVRFGFWVRGEMPEYASGSVAPLVIAKFAEFHEARRFAFSERVYQADMRSWVETTDAEGRTRARFMRSGRKFDAELKLV